MTVQWTNWFWARSLDLTLFLDFLNFFPIVSRNKLHVSTNFIILGAMDQKLYVFENFRRSLGSQRTFDFDLFIFLNAYMTALFVSFGLKCLSDELRVFTRQEWKPKLSLSRQIFLSKLIQIP
jgi:hypothetical protein